MKLTKYDLMQTTRYGKERMPWTNKMGERAHFWTTKTCGIYFAHLCRHHPADKPDPDCEECKGQEQQKYLTNIKWRHYKKWST